MGKGLITNNIGDGQYKVQLIHDRGTLDKQIANLQAKIVYENGEITKIQSEIENCISETPEPDPEQQTDPEPVTDPEPESDPEESQDPEQSQDPQPESDPVQKTDPAQKTDPEQKSDPEEKQDPEYPDPPPPDPPVPNEFDGVIQVTY